MLEYVPASDLLASLAKHVTSVIDVARSGGNVSWGDLALGLDDGLAVGLDDPLLSALLGETESFTANAAVELCDRLGCSHTALALTGIRTEAYIIAQAARDARGSEASLKGHALAPAPCDSQPPSATMEALEAEMELAMERHLARRTGSS